MPLGTLFFTASLTPSLLPRTVVFQGVVSGVSLAVGYAIGRLARSLWTFLELLVPGEGRTRQITRVAATICAIIAVIECQRDRECVLGLS